MTDHDDSLPPVPELLAEYQTVQHEVQTTLLALDGQVLPAEVQSRVERVVAGRASLAAHVALALNDQLTRERALLATIRECGLLARGALTDRP